MVMVCNLSSYLWRTLSLKQKWQIRCGTLFWRNHVLAITCSIFLTTSSTGSLFLRSSSMQPLTCTPNTPTLLQPVLVDPHHSRGPPLLLRPTRDSWMSSCALLSSPVILIVLDPKQVQGGWDLIPAPTGDVLGRAEGSIGLHHDHQLLGRLQWYVRGHHPPHSRLNSGNDNKFPRLARKLLLLQPPSVSAGE